MNLGMGELILIFIVALLVFGPKKLPELGKSLGRAMHEFKKATNELKNNLETEVGTAQIKEELLKQQQEIQSGLAAITTVDTKPPETEEAYAAGSAEVKTETAPASKSEAPAEEKKPETSEASKSHAG
jgi:TatA/E family protein of Tat protein translocase